MPLIIAPLNVDLNIIKVLATDKVKKHLESLGICPNEQVKILSRSNGNIICVIKNGRIAIDNSIASKILVR